MKHLFLKRAVHSGYLSSIRILGCTAFLGLALSGSMAVAQTTYHYTGNNFTLFSCGPNSDNTATMDCSTPAPTNTHTSYTASDHVTATLTLDTSLGPNFAYADVSGLPGFQLTLSDGQHTVQTPLGSGQGLFSFVSTDSTGKINQWRLGINTGGAQNGGIITFNFTDVSGPQIFDQGTLACCDPTVPGNLAMNFSMPGTWDSGTSVSDPASLTNNLINQVSNPLLGLSSGQIRVFTLLLNGALQSINAGRNRLAILQLRGFIETVRLSRRFGGMSGETANTLINSAQAIIALL